ncbi:hypothetical protein EDB92DRAFT_122825 [Lactarius akahatsu]|uniref:CCHC-type domain-containing protein n=1 Tax=Lactarius akahatsu TaxID=416441 RepID=A0AAD4LD41_9AGAM|nr:hypothetical protein EDB92DRAFT_122825 [Lactarius akahatsu]
MASASLVQVIDLTDSPPPTPINYGTRKIRKSPDVTATRASRRRKNGETGRTRTLAGSRGCSPEVGDVRLEEGVESRRVGRTKGRNGESTKKRSRRSMKSKDKGKDPVSEDAQQDSPPTLDDSQFFFVDTTPAAVPAGMVFDSGGVDTTQSSSSRIPEPEADKTPLLLLPAHVSFLDAVDDSELPIQIIQPEDSDSDAESYIEYLDYDDRLTAGTVRYFETPAEEQKQTRFVCKRCGAESEHRTRDCPIMITCGVRDEHSTRSCPISKTCFTCGMKGHINRTCPNRHSRGKVSQYDDCDRCGSHTHNTNECPTIWRLYEYVTEREREAILRHREARRSLALGEGGEGYIAHDEWCYNCGNSGHLGDDCKDPRPHDTLAAPSSFGQFNTFTGPFSDSVAAPPVHARAPRDWETSQSFGDGWGGNAPINVGKRARNKDRMRMEQRALEIEELADPDDWFGNARNVRNRGMGGGSTRRDRDRGGGTKDVKIRFLETANDPGPSLLDRVHIDYDRRDRRYRDLLDQRHGRDHGERHHRDRDRERDRDDGEPGPGLRIRGSASRGNDRPRRDDGDRWEERRGDDRRWEDSRSGDREQERYKGGYREPPRGHDRGRRESWEGRGTRGPQYKGGYAR